MRHLKAGRKLNRTGAHRTAMLRNTVANLFTVEAKAGQPRRITTTIPKAKEARRLAERLITLGKKGDLAARRRALSLLPKKAVVKQLFEDIAPLYKDRPGGYTRILRLTKHRLGDGADLCFLELVTGPVEAAAPPAEPVAPRRTEEPKAEGPKPEEPKAEAEKAPETTPPAVPEPPAAP
jgi:large subunit ribosomal protein L17